MGRSQKGLGSVGVAERVVIRTRHPRASARGFWGERCDAPRVAVAVEPYSEGRAGDAAVGADFLSWPDSPNAVLSGGKNQKNIFLPQPFSGASEA